MRHRKAGKQLGVNSSHRRAMLRNMVTSLFEHEQIETTDTRAKALRPVAEKMITLAKRGDLHARRQALSYMKNNEVTHRLFEEIKERYLDRQGGYLRIVKKGVRKGDGASISIVQLLQSEDGKKAGKRKGEKKASGKAAKAAKSDKSVEETSSKRKDQSEVIENKEDTGNKDTKNNAS